MYHLMTIENADRFRLAGHAICLGSQFIIDITAEAVEVVLAVFVGDVGANLKSLGVFEEDHCARSWRARF